MELKKELPDVGLCAVFVIVGKRFEINVFDAYDVVNIKLPPEKILNLIDRMHFYPAYHMNKKHWITIALDKEVDEPLVQQLLEECYGLVEK